MATGVGLYIGASDAVAAVITGHNTEPILVARESILHMSPDGESVLGGPVPDGYASISDYLSFVGSPAGIAVDDSEPYRAEDLVATAVFNLINLVAPHLTGPAEFYAAYPAEWPATNVRLLREALDYLGLRSVALTASTEQGAPAASAAARMAHSAVLATPAGTTPPDPSGLAETANVNTAVLPTMDKETSGATAYSKAYPADTFSATAAGRPDSKPSASEMPGRFPAAAATPITPSPAAHRVAIGAMIVAVAALAAAGVFGGMALHNVTGKSRDRIQAAPRPVTVIVPPVTTTRVTPTSVRPTSVPLPARSHTPRAAPVSAPPARPAPVHRATAPPTPVPAAPAPPVSTQAGPPPDQQPYPYTPNWRGPYGGYSPFDDEFPFDGGGSRTAPSQLSQGGLSTPFAPTFDQSPR